MPTLSPRLQRIFEETRTICFGRFIIQMPAKADVVYGPVEAEANIVFYSDEAGSVAQRLSKRLTQIEEEKEYFLPADFPRLPLFGKVIDGDVPGQKIVIGSKDRVGYAIDSFLPIGNDLFIQSIGSILPNEANIAELNNVALHLLPRREDEIPAGSGSCIEGGFIPLDLKYERVTIGIRLKEFPDVHISLDVHRNLDRLPSGSSPKLLREEAKQMAEEDGLGSVFSRAKIFREGPRQLDAWNGEEVALRTPAYKDDMEAHEFRFHSMGAVNDSLHPELEIRLDSGLRGNEKARVKPSITDEEALAIWDRLIGTIRLRRPSDATPTP